jgi:hypothetical protein
MKRQLGMREARRASELKLRATCSVLHVHVHQLGGQHHAAVQIGHDP